MITHTFYTCGKCDRDFANKANCLRHELVCPGKVFKCTWELYRNRDGHWQMLECVSTESCEYLDGKYRLTDIGIGIVLDKVSKCAETGSGCHGFKAEFYTLSKDEVPKRRDEAKDFLKKMAEKAVREMMKNPVKEV